MVLLTGALILSQQKHFYVRVRYCYAWWENFGCTIIDNVHLYVLQFKFETNPETNF